MRYRMKVLLGLLALSIPFWFGFILVPYVSCEVMKITLSMRLVAGIVCESFASVSAVLVIIGVVLVFYNEISAKLSGINEERRVDPGR